MTELTISKVANQNPVIAGNMLSYTITITNLGPEIALDASLIDTLPICILNPQYSLDNINFNPWNNMLFLGNISVNQVITVYIKGQVDSGCDGIILNTATVVSITEDINPNNRTTTSNTVVDTLASLFVTKIDSVDTIIAGQPLSYTITIQNNGPSNAINTSVTDVVPSCLLNPQYSLDNINFNNWEDILILGTILPNAIITIYIKGIVDPNCLGIIENTVTLNSPTPDTNLCNRTSTITTTIEGLASLNVVKTVNCDPIIIDKEIIYTITVANNGPSTAVCVNINDVLPNCILNQEYSINDIDWFLWNDSLPIGNLNSGETFTFKIKGLISESCPFTISNTVTVISETPDKTPQNRSYTLTTQIIRELADLVINKLANPNPISPCEILTFSLIINNFGPTSALDVNLIDYIDECILNPEYSIDGLVWQQWTGALYIGTVLLDETIIVQIRGVLDPSCSKHIIVNTATLQSPTVDPNEETRTSTINVPVIPPPDIKITKCADKECVNIGDTIKYTVKIKNDGISPAYGVIFKDILDKNTELIYGTVKLNSEIVPVKDLSCGISLGTIDGCSENDITYCVKVLKPTCKTSCIENCAYASYYDISVTKGCHKQKTVKRIVQIRFNEKQKTIVPFKSKLSLPCNKPNIEELNKINSCVLIDNYYIDECDENNLIVEGKLKISLTYKSTISRCVEWCLPFTSNIKIKNCSNIDNIEVSGKTKNDTAFLIDTRSIKFSTNIIFKIKNKDIVV